MKKFASILAISVSAIVLAGCTPPAPGEVSEENFNPEGIVLEFSSSPEVSAAPVWERGSDVDGWTQIEVSQDALDDAERQGFEIPEPEFWNEDSSCNVVAERDFITSTNSGRNALFMSQEYIYNLFDAYPDANAEFSAPQIVNMSTSQGSIQAFAMKYQAEGFAPFPDASEGYKVVRVFDTVVDTGLSVDLDALDPSIDPETLPDISKGFPVAILTYACSAGSLDDSLDPLSLFSLNIG